MFSLVALQIVLKFLFYSAFSFNINISLAKVGPQNDNFHIFKTQVVQNQTLCCKPPNSPISGVSQVVFLKNNKNFVVEENHNLR